MFARVSTYQSPPDQLTDAAVDSLRAKILPTVSAMDGFRGVLLLVDGDSGKQMSVTLWESEDARRASQESAKRVREEAAKTTSAEVAAVENYDAVIVEVR